MGVNLPPLPDGIVSPPTRAEWIEIGADAIAAAKSVSLRPHGRSGLKFLCSSALLAYQSLRPHGRSGLKSRMPESP